MNHYTYIFSENPGKCQKIKMTKYERDKKMKMKTNEKKLQSHNVNL